MGILTRAVVWRWLARWLMRGSPATVVAKLAAVGALGAWRYHRKRKKLAADEPGRIEAEYEVLGPDRIGSGGARPTSEPRSSLKGTGEREVDDDPPTF
jgi:hypothetical protein